LLEVPGRSTGDGLVALSYRYPWSNQGDSSSVVQWLATPPEMPLHDSEKPVDSLVLVPAGG